MDSGWESENLEARTAKRFIPRETKEQNAFDFASRVARLKRKEEYSRERDFNLRLEKALWGMLFFAFLHSAVRQSWRSRRPVRLPARGDRYFTFPSVQSAQSAVKLFRSLFKEVESSHYEQAH